MQYMLDTDICIHLIRKKALALLRKIEAHKPEDLCLSSITLSELEYGVHKSDRPDQNSIALTQFVSPFTILPFDQAAAIRYGILRADIEDSGKPIGSMDMLIAAHALSAGLTLVTGNTNEFDRVKGLKVVNWAKQG